MRVAVLLLAAFLLFSDAVQAIATDSSIDKKRAIQLTPKWSLPFQGQLGAASAKNDSSQSGQLTAQANPAIQPETKAPSAVPTKSNELSLFKQQKYAVLTIAPTGVPNDKLIASAASILGDDQTAVTVDKDGKPLITGGVSAWGGPFDVDRIVNHLVDTHFENSAEGQKLDKSVKHLNSFPSKAVAATKDGLNYAFEYQGIDPSVRAGRLITDTHDYKVRNNAWAEYERQRYIDQIHFQVISSLMEIAEGIGNSETDRGSKSIGVGKESLSVLVGDQESERAARALTQWLNNIPVSYANFAQTPWTTMERTKKLEEILKAAVKNDPVITKVTQQVYKYGHPNKAFQYSSGVIQSTLDAIALFAPGIIPTVAAGTAEVAYKLGTGGTELNKLERELLLDKRIQSRLKVITQESSLALDSYRYALVTKNPPLMAFSEEVIGNLTGNSEVPKIVSAQSDFKVDTVIPELKESTPEKDKHRLVKIPLVN